MNDYNAMKEIITDMEKVAKALEIEPFPIYFLGGSACILGQYSQRATRDFDFVDQHYPAHYGKVLRYLNDFDMLEYESTILAPSYMERAIRLEEFEYLRIFVLSREDIIVSKIIRMEPKDIEDIDQLIIGCDRGLIVDIIEEVLNRKDLYPAKREGFIRNLPVFGKKYNV